MPACYESGQKICFLKQSAKFCNYCYLPSITARVSRILSPKNVRQRAGFAGGGEFYIHLPGTAAWLFDKVKY